MSPSRRLALALVAALVAAGGAASGPAAGETTVEVQDLTLPVIDLRLESASLDRSVRRSESRANVRVTLAADVVFPFDSARLTGKARGRIAEIAREIRRERPDRVTIEGHTDSKGSGAFNSRLSLRRARAVARALTRTLGRSAPRLVATGKGESQPVAANRAPDGGDDPRGRALNRRVEIAIPRR